MSTFLDHMQPILIKEGGDKYTNDPVDRGGETKWGITVARARAAGYTGSMRDMTLAQALSIYELYYWEQPGFGQIDPLCPDLAHLLLDLGINFGPTVPTRFLQRALNVLNAEGTHWPDTAVDGMAGAGTRYALKRFLERRGIRGQQVIVDMVRAQASLRYMEIAESRPDQERFEWGWQAQRAFGTKEA